MKTETNIIENKNLVYSHRLTSAQKIKLWLSRIFLWVMILIVMYPIYFVIIASLSTGDAFFAGSLLPKQVSFENYRAVIQDTDFLIWAKNSMLVCTSVALVQIIMSITSAYAFSRMKFKGRKSGLMSLLLLQMFPAIMALSAILGLAYRLNFMDNIWALVILLAGGSAYNIWLLKGYIDNLPRELDEAAMVDGASHWQVFSKIILPLAKPQIAVIFLFCFIGTYSEFILTSALIKAPENFTMAVGLRSFIDNQFSAHWTQYSAAAIMASLPVMIIFMALQKFIAKGLVAGAVKG